MAHVQLAYIQLGVHLDPLFFFYKATFQLGGPSMHWYLFLVWLLLFALSCFCLFICFGFVVIVFVVLFLVKTYYYSTYSDTLSSKVLASLFCFHFLHFMKFNTALKIWLTLFAGAVHCWLMFSSPPGPLGPFQQDGFLDTQTLANAISLVVSSQMQDLSLLFVKV